MRSTQNQEATGRNKAIDREIAVGLKKMILLLARVV
jgi:hypothetical protein